jgi:alkylated DNA repair dioxygenase AlkB
MAMTQLQLPGAELEFDRHWLSRHEADELMAALLDAVPWEIHRIRLFGREVDSPRLSCWIGDPQARYRYSGSLFAPRPWPACLLAVRARLSRQLDVALNSVLVNRYRSGRDAMGWHSDNESELGQQPVIASLSLGATRRFKLKGRGPGGPGLELDLPHGSLLVMRGDTQTHYRHALPRTARPVDERINLTFRQILDVASPRRVDLSQR